MLKQTLKGTSGEVCSIAFSPNNLHVAAGWSDSLIRIWDLTTGTLEQVMRGHSSGIHAVAFSLDGRSLVSGSGDSTVKLWDVATGTLQRTLQHDADVYTVAFSTDNHLIVSGSRENTVRTWNAIDGTLLQERSQHYDMINPVALLLHDPFKILDIESRWITISGVKVIYLPENRQVQIMDACKDKIVIGSPSGLVTLYQFQLAGDHLV